MKKKIISVTVSAAQIARAGEIAKQLSAVEGRPVSRSEVVGAAIDMLGEACPVAEIEEEASRARAALSGNTGVAALRNRLRANLAQSVEQRFRKPRAPIILRAA